MSIEWLHPPDWPAPRGYSNGARVRGELVFVAGQIGWDADGSFGGRDFVGQTKTALENVLAVLAEAGAGPEHIVRMTWYITDRRAYLDNLQELGRAYRDVLGRHYPTMSVVVVAGLVEAEAMVEIEATAVLADTAAGD